MSVKQLFKNPTMLAPMAGYTDSAFRSIARSFCCGLTVTEMVSSMAICQGNSQTRELLFREKNDDNCAVQIFGHHAEIMADSVDILKEYNFQAIDINMGCPVKKIVSNGDGSALLENFQLAGKIVSAVKNRAKDIPVSAKIRLGVDNCDNAVDFVKMLEASGADFVCVHFRTRKQFYSGQADYRLLPKIVQAVKIPIVANGDIDSKQKMQCVLDMGAFAVAVGRSALGNPKIFANLLDKPVEFHLLNTIRQHITLAKSAKSPQIVCNEMKKHLAYYLKGRRASKAVVVAIMKTKSTDEQLALVENFLAQNN